MSIDCTDWQRAVSFAARAHKHQLRKDNATPYFAHPVRVAMTVMYVFECHDECIISAALLHDVIEDTTVDYDDLLAEFGSEVADIVAALSKDFRMVEHEREPAYDRQLADGPWQARLIKLADVHDNLSDAVDDAALDNAREKAGRALTLAEGDPRLDTAAAAVKRLLN